MEKLKSILLVTFIAIAFTSTDAITIHEVLGDELSILISQNKSDEEIQTIVAERLKNYRDQGMSDEQIILHIKKRSIQEYDMMNDQKKLPDSDFIEICEIFNLKSNTSKMLLDICIDVPKKEVQNYTKYISNKLIAIGSSKSFEEIASKKGKAKFRAQLIESINVSELYFTRLKAY